MTPPPTPSDADLILANWSIIWYIIGGLAFVLSVGVFFLVRTVKKNLPVIKNFTQMVEDWTGEPAVKGDGPEGIDTVTVKKARFGMMARMTIVEEAQVAQVISMQVQSDTLARLEDVQEVQGTKLEVVRHEVEHNNGTSIKDALKRTEEDVKLLHGVVSDMDAKVEGLTDLIGARIKPSLLSIEANVIRTTEVVQEPLILEER